MWALLLVISTIGKDWRTLRSTVYRGEERFIIHYVYRILIGLLHFNWFEVYFERGIKLRTKYQHRAPPRIRKIRHNSFFYKGPQLYNLLPIDLRQVEEIVNPSQSHVDNFKRRLDKFLSQIPDQPTVPGLHRIAATNSLICQIPIYRREHPN